ncbi:MAG: glycosyltransferase [candidate division WOR-3 bacterium]
MKFSLILATKNRKKELVNFLESLKRQSYKNFELIVCDQNKEGFLKKIIANYSSEFEINHLYTRSGLSKARNDGLRWVKGDIIAFPDDDCIYSDDLLEKVVNKFKEVEELDGFCGRPVNFEGKTTAGKFLKKSKWVKLLEAPFVFCSFTMFLKKKVIEEVGEFNENLGLGAESKFLSSEDLDYGIRILKKGFKIFYDPELIVFHPEKEKIFNKEVLERAYKYALSTGYVLKKHDFPWWYCIYYILRPLGGVFISGLKGNFPKLKWHSVKFLGRLQGYITENTI